MIPGRIAAIPARIPAHFEDAAPGHRFQMYFAYWEQGRYTAYKNARLPDIKHLANNEPDRIRKQFDAEKKAPLGEACPLGKSTKATLDGLRTRQRSLINTHSDKGYRRSAMSTAPFATGLGLEHPIENGFAFLTPYGLPYLAGSGVKGVLRRAMEELALFPEDGNSEIDADTAPTLLDVWWLFGFEGAAGSIWENHSQHGKAFNDALPALAARDELREFIAAIVTDKKVRAGYLDDTEDRRLAFLQRLLTDNAFRQSLAYRGALDCWDVFPAPAGNRLVVEIMTPHHSGYFQNGGTPHDAESPIPVPFLAVPAGSAFDFHLVCHTDGLPQSLQNRWRTLLDASFKHAFDWLGFGAKTAVGYGAMASIAAKAPERPGAGPTKVVPVAQAASEAVDTVWPAARLTLNPGTGEIKANFEGKTTAGLKNADAGTLWSALGDRANKLKKDKELKNVSVKVQFQGNFIKLIGLAP